MNSERTDGAPGRHLGSGLRLAAVLAALALHLALVLRHFPLAIAFNGEVPIHGDTSRYFATLHGAAQVRGLYGYDPDFMAGYPVGLWNSVGKKGFEIAHRLLPFLSLPAVFYWTLVGVALSAPLLMWFGLRRFCEDRAGRATLLFAILGYWHLSTQTAYFWQWGNVFFPAVSALLPPALGLFWDLLNGRRPLRSGLLAGGLVALLFYCHTGVLAAALVPAALAAALHRPAWRRGRTWLGVAAAGAVAALLCVWWLVPLWENRLYCVPKPQPWFQTTWKHFVMDVFSDRAYRHPFDRNLLLHAAWVFGAAGSVYAWRRNRFVSVLGVGGLAAIGIAYGASGLGPVSAIQPYRFLIPAVLLLLAPAAVGAKWAAQAVWNAGRQARLAAALLLLTIAPAFTAYLIDLAWERPPCATDRHYRPVVAAVRHLPIRGRVLCDDMPLGHILPYSCGVSVLGGLSTQAFTAHRFAGFDNDGALFGRPAGQWTPATLRPYLDMYAAEYAILVRSDWVAFAERAPSLFEPVVTVAGHRVFRVRDAAPSLALDGAAEVVAGPDRIEVSGVRARTLVLKLHYAAWLKATDGVILAPAAFRDDPVPFIKAVAPAGVGRFSIGRRQGALARVWTGSP